MVTVQIAYILVFPLLHPLNLWTDILPTLARRTRKDLLSDLGALREVIYALGGEAAIARPSAPSRTWGAGGRSWGARHPGAAFWQGSLADFQIVPTLNGP